MLPENEHEDYSQYSENSHSNLTKSRLDPACPCVFLFFEGTNKQLQRKDRGCPASFYLKVFYFFCLSEARIRSLEMFPFSSPPSFEARIRASPKKIRKHMKLKGSLAYVESSKNLALRLFN